MDILDLLGLDIGKSTFHLIGHDANGKDVLRKKLNGSRLLDLAVRLKPCTIAMDVSNDLQYSLVGRAPTVH